jgi:hypothetical protein
MFFEGQHENEDFPQMSNYLIIQNFSNLVFRGHFHDVNLRLNVQGRNLIISI